MQRRAYVIADNKLAELSGWDDAMLAAEFRALQTDGFDLDLVGFSEREIAELLDQDITAALGDPDAAPPLQVREVSCGGDVWILGRHRLMCGSSMNADQVGHLMHGKKAECVFTDPPYGVAYSGGSATKSIAGDITQAAIPVAFKHAIDIATAENARLYFCGGSSNVMMYYALFDSYLRSMPSMIIWDKGNIVLRRNNYHSQYEVIFYGWKGSGGGNDYWFSGRTSDEASDIWKVKRDNSSDYVHPTQKPIELAARAMRNSTPPSGLVYEPFSGSGSTIVAAESTGRSCYAMELAPNYVDVAVRRWQEFTGQHATLEGTDQTFDQIAQERAIAQDAA